MKIFRILALIFVLCDIVNLIYGTYTLKIGNILFGNLCVFIGLLMGIKPV